MDSFNSKKLSLSIFLIILPFFSIINSQILSADIDINTSTIISPFANNLLGGNFLVSVKDSETLNKPAFISAAKQMGIGLIRWPGGNVANVYNWKTNEQVNPGKRLIEDDLITLEKILEFCIGINAELTITVNFATMTPQDAADLVEFLNGPVNSTWGKVRAEMGFPNPINVRYFEIGNEQDLPSSWYFSWTAEDPVKYFFGGNEERRGYYAGSLNDRIGAKGDFFKANGGPNQTYYLRFTPVKNVTVFWAENSIAAENRIYETWAEVQNFANQTANAKVFTADTANGTVKFGDGIHGAMPPENSFFLIEYTTLNHPGFLDFARAMRMVDSSVPIKIGAAALPFKDGELIDIPLDSLLVISEQTDFFVRHQYNAGFPYDTYNSRRQISNERITNLYNGQMLSILDSLGIEKEYGVAVSEWNIFLDPDYWQINRTMEAAVIAADWFINLINKKDSLNVLYAEQFALHGGNLSLIRTQGNYSIAPLGFVFEGFKTWRNDKVVSTNVDSPYDLAYNLDLPLVNAAASISNSKDILHVVITNNSKDKPVLCNISLVSFSVKSGKVQLLTADHYTSSNDSDPQNIQFKTEYFNGSRDTLTVPPHSMVFIIYYSETTKVSNEEIESLGFRLYPNYPNPFNPVTKIKFTLTPTEGRERVLLKVYDVLGREIETLVDDILAVGKYEIEFDGSSLPSGVYVLKLSNGYFNTTKKIMLLK